MLPSCCPAFVAVAGCWTDHAAWCDTKKPPCRCGRQKTVEKKDSSNQDQQTNSWQTPVARYKETTTKMKNNKVITAMVIRSTQGSGWAHSVARPCNPISSLLTHMVYLWPFLNYLTGSKSVSARPSHPDTMTNTALVAIATSRAAETSPECFIVNNHMLLQYVVACLKNISEQKYKIYHI